MLPSRGYFSGISCVFFSDGGCIRPHCHYRHSHQDAVPSDVVPKTRHSKLLTRSPKHFICESDLNGWCPEQVSMVTKLVENAVDKALRSDPTKMPRTALAKNTLDPEAPKMASKRKSSRQVEPVPAYEPTPISKLTTDQVPSVPENPYFSPTKSRATDSSIQLARKLTPSNTKPTLNSEDPSPTMKNIYLQESYLTQSFYRNNINQCSLAEDSEHMPQPENVAMQCALPLIKLGKLDLDKSSRSEDNGERSSGPKATCKGKTTPVKKTKVNIKNILLLSRNSTPTATGNNSGKIPAKLKSQDSVASGIKDRPNPDAHTDSVDVDVMKLNPSKSKYKLEKYEYEPPAKMTKSESASQLTLQVSSAADPFSRWMQNKKIRQILGKDKKIKVCKNSGSESRVRKSLSFHGMPSNKNAPGSEDEPPEPKYSKRIAHVQDDFRPAPIAAGNDKIPSALRHHFCAAFFSEFKKLMHPDEATRRAAEEELQAAKNSKTAKTYKNNCSLLIVKYRKGEIEDVKVKPVDLTPVSCPDFTYGWSLFKSFSIYLLSESELRDNGFPLVVPNKPNCAYVDKASRRYATQQAENGHKVCANCSVEFRVDGNGFPTSKNDCFYHWGKLRRVQYKGQIVEKFACCGGSVDSAPCEFSIYHVWSGGSEDCMEDFVETRKLPSHMEDHEAGIYALDCEMCYTTAGLELARLTVLDLNGRVVFDEVVSMKNPVLNYCTRFSGIDALKAASATHTFDDVRAWILGHFYDKTILVGHSLENDLKALKLIHRTIVDTSVTFPHKFGPPNKRSLKHLASAVLELNIQENTDGHDSKEDAATCLKLMMKKIREDSKVRKPRVVIGYNGKH